MYFVIFCTDKPDAEQLRKEVRPVHRDWLRGRHKKVVLRYSGATLAGESTRMVGSLLIVEADSLQDVEEFTRQDPYRKAGLFDNVQIRRWDWTFGNPDGSTSVNPI
jgi:hypothetical protein